MTRYETLAAVDLGSNSFHLQVGRVVGGQIYPLDAVREVVRLGAGLTADKKIDRATQANALETLRRFHERLRGFPRGAVRAVGTNALRVARNSAAFLREARDALGYPIEVIAGREEARLIYLGVAHSLATTPQRRLVVDIGGGSTECIVGTGLEPELMESLYMGCVSYSLRFFPDGRVDKARMKAAESAARGELAGIVAAYRHSGWQEVVASSGTARSIESILRAAGFADGGIGRDALERLRTLLLREGAAEPDRIPGLRPNRAPVLPGGLAILIAVFDELGIGEARVSEEALRHGVLYDLLGRFERRDMREVTVAAFMRRYHVDSEQAARVSSLALAVFDGIAASANGGATPEEREVDRTMLDWASRLAETGLSIAHADYHKHSAYVLMNADMPGFSKMEQQRLARIVLAHRGKLAKVTDEGLEDVDAWLVFSLRFATTVLRRRVDLVLPRVKVAVLESTGFRVEIARAWLDENPLTADALESEAEYWKAVGRTFEIRALSDRQAAAASR